MLFVNKGYHGYGIQRIDYGVTFCLNGNIRIGPACFSFWVIVVVLRDDGGNGGIGMIGG